MALRLDLLLELPRGDVQVSVANERRDDLPIGAVIENHSDPSAGTDVGRPEETIGVLVDQSLLRPERLGEPHGDVLGAVMVAIEHGEDLALAREPGGLAVRDLLDRLGKRHADRPQTEKHALVFAREATDRVSGGGLGWHDAPAIDRFEESRSWVNH